MQGPLPLQTREQTRIDWCFKGQTSLLQVTTNLLYHCFVESLGWLSSKAEEEWRIHKSDHGRWQILQRSWPSKLPTVAKVFIWSVLIGGLPLGLALKRRGLATGNCFFCIVQNGRRQYSSIYTMSNCLLDLELHFSNSASFITVLFDT